MTWSHDWSQINTKFLFLMYLLMCQQAKLLIKLWETVSNSSATQSSWEFWAKGDGSGGNRKAIDCKSNVRIFSWKRFKIRFRFTNDARLVIDYLFRKWWTSWNWRWIEQWIYRWVVVVKVVPPPEGKNLLGSHWVLSHEDL